MKLQPYEPKLEELWFRQKMLEDEDTMSFNEAWGGTISFTVEKWEERFDRWVINNETVIYYRYLVNEDNVFVGEVAYHYDSSYKGFMANVLIYAKYRKKGYGTLGLQILCDEAKRNGVSCLFDNIAIDNPGISIFKRLGFKEELRTSEIILLKKDL